MKRRFLGIKKRLSPYLYFFPALVLAYLFSYRPFAKTFLNSFSLVNFAGKIIGFVGLDNFKALIFDPNFQTSLINTFKFAFVFIPLDLLFCLICALLVYKKRRFTALNETLFMLPMAVAMSSAALVFKAIFNP
ncbi:MAG: sugar ABC transporter permease, partial [Sphaerochaetaceae bacterium]|nr:sugar ABC transporter permease [Sphaerochaetaceae bacterium]